MKSILSQIEQRVRFAPIRNLTPEKLVRMLDAFEQGYLAEAALAWETIEKRDDTIKSVAPKRKKAVARHGWEVIVLPNLPCEAQTEALRHKAALEYFYTNLTCANALDGNEQGGFKLLIRQMMDAVGKRYAVHEIVWKVESSPESLVLSPEPKSSAESLVLSAECEAKEGKEDFTEGKKGNEEGRKGGLNAKDAKSAKVFGKGEPAEAGTTYFPKRAEARTPYSAYHLTAEFRFVPLWFFENRTGKLRFLKNPYAVEGDPLKPGAWMVTVGEGLMTACAVAWMYKHLPLQDWLDFSQRYAHPALVASTTAARDSTEWNYLEKALEDFLSTLSAVTSSTESIKLMDLKGGGELPYERLVSRMDRLITALWRGADLSTLSREQGYGASLQSGESDILEQDDAELISETLQASVDRYVIEYLFGRGVRPLAAVKILVTPKLSTPQDLQIDQFLIDHGARLAVNDALARYGRAEANPGEPFLSDKSLVLSSESMGESSESSVLSSEWEQKEGVKREESLGRSPESLVLSPESEKRREGIKRQGRQDRQGEGEEEEVPPKIYENRKNGSSHTNGAAEFGGNEARENRGA